jgi:murein L,D-transpeptidase YcbB/YkuD
LKKTLLFLLLCLFLSSCGWFNTKPEIATVLSEHFDNELYEKFDTVAYGLFFSQKMDELSSKLSNPKVTKAFYASNLNNPVLTTKFYTNGILDTLKHYIESSKFDGFNPEVFHFTEISKLLSELNANKFKNINQFYPVLAELEILTADALLRYTNYMKYGAVNPRKIYTRFYIEVKRADSLKMDSVLNSSDIASILKDVQPKSKSYIDLKQQLAFYIDSIGNENNLAIKTIKLNLERLRWQLPIGTEEIVRVNIPDFSLTWFKNNDTLSHMNVCVGAKREAAYVEKMKIFSKSGNLDDKPINHETPQLISVFNAIQVNPVWNIPVSIAQSEIYWKARNDPYYLSNSNIKVYYKGKLIREPDTIQWSKYSRDKLPFQFKQGSGDNNALGKFKFVFDNSSSIYLHDTNNKSGFKLKNRAISHGCVRIENPLQFAELMVKSKNQYDDLRIEVSLPPIDTNKMEKYKKKQAKIIDTLNAFKLKPTWFATRKNVAVVIDYFTAWAENGKVQFRPDVYEYDHILWDALKKYM